MTQGNGPPAGVSGSELWQRLSQTPRPWKDVPFPRRGFEGSVRLVVLTERELMACRAAAERYAKSSLGEDKAKADEQNLAYREIYDNERVVQVVCAACRDPQSASIESRAFPSPDMARAVFTSDEWAVLFEAYIQHQTESGPIISHMTVEEMDAWVERLSEGAGQVPLWQLSSAAKNDLIKHLASRCLTSPTASISAGALQDEPSTASPQS